MPEARCGNVVDECVHPDVDDALRIEGCRDPPLLALAADRYVVESRLDDVQDLVASNVGLEEARFVRVVSKKRLLILA